MATILILALNPLTIFFMVGVAHYTSRCPYLMGMGLASPESFNLDPNTRCFPGGNLGCMRSGDEWVYESPHNTALKTLVSLFGPPPHSYDGPYPNQEEAVEATKMGIPITAKEFVSGTIPLTNHPVHLAPQQAAKISSLILGDRSLAESDTEDNSSTKEKLTASLWQDRCLIVHQQWIESDGNILSDSMVLIDIKTTRPFAVYRLSKESSIPYNRIHTFW